MSKAPKPANTQLVSTGPYAPQAPYIDQLFSGASDLYQRGPIKYFPGETVAPTNPTLAGSQGAISDYVNNAVLPQNQDLTQSAQMVAGGAFGSPLARAGQSVAGQLAPTLNAAMAGGQSVTPTSVSAALAPELQSSLRGGALNPYLEQVVGAATRANTRNFQDNVLPGLRTDATAAGQYGTGTRPDIAQGIATSRLNQDNADIAARLYANAFDQGAAERNNALGLSLSAAQADQSAGLQAGAQNTDAILNAAQLSAGLAQGGQASALDQYFRGVSLVPALQNQNLDSLGTVNNVGLQQQQLAQAQRDSEVERYFFEQYAPYLALAQYQNFIGGSYGSTPLGVTTVNNRGGVGPQTPITPRGPVRG